MSNKNTQAIILNNELRENRKNFVSKLKRLQMQESLIEKNIKADCYRPFISKTNEDSEIVNHNNEIKRKISELRDDFKEIKSSTCFSQEEESIDINDVKRMLISFENKLKEFKQLVLTELSSLQVQEEALFIKISENSTSCKPIKFPKKSLTYCSSSARSPVKSIIQSSFRSPDVQQYHEFMTNSRNRYGGWNEYNYNIFAKCWFKYFFYDNERDIYEKTLNANKTEEYHNFVREIMETISGITLEEIQSYTKWFSKYLYLREKQRMAIEKWKVNKKAKKYAKNNECEEKKTLQVNYKSKRNTDQKVMKFASNEQEYPGEETAVSLQFFSGCYNDSTVKDNVKKDALTRLAKPTMQWNYRCAKEKQSQRFDQCAPISNNKLGIPKWRIPMISFL